MNALTDGQLLHYRGIEIIQGRIDGIEKDVLEVCTVFSSISVDDLCRLFFANHYIEYDYRSYCKDENNRADYLIELIDRYEAFEYGILPNALIVLSTSKKYPLLMEEMKVAEHIAEMSKGVIRFIVKTDDALEQELRMNIAFYAYEEKKTEQYRKLESQK